MELGTKSSDFILFKDAVTNETKQHLHKRRQYPTVYTINSRKEHCGRSTFQIKIAKLRQALGNAGTAGSENAVRRPIAQASPLATLSALPSQSFLCHHSTSYFCCQVVVHVGHSCAMSSSLSPIKEQPLGKRNPGCRAFWIWRSCFAATVTHFGFGCRSVRSMLRASFWRGRFVLN